MLPLRHYYHYFRAMLRIRCLHATTRLLMPRLIDMPLLFAAILLPLRHLRCHMMRAADTADADAAMLAAGYAILRHMPRLRSPPPFLHYADYADAIC